MLYKKANQNIGEIIKFGAKSLIDDSPTFRLDSEILLAFVLKKNREFLYSNFEKRIFQKDFKYFERLIKKRKQKYPIAYITGKREFFGNTYQISKDVLIPRPETENLIEIILKEIENHFSNTNKIHILEIGSGSGCIPITLKKLLKQKAVIHSYEISKKAFGQAILNYKLIKPGRISFKNIDAFKNISTTRKFDLIISNPPYLTKIDMDNLDTDVVFEPKTALYGGVDGLKYYRQLNRLLRLQLTKKGIAVFEINENLGEETAAIFQKEYSCKIIKDYYKKDRFILISPR